MKRFVLFVCLLIFLLLIPAGVSADGWINISSTPSGATITIDSLFIGPTPRNTSYANGSHSVSIMASGYPEYLTTVTVAENATVYINHVFVNSAPTISSLSKTTGYNTSTLTDVTITGTGFSTSGATVVLFRTGLSNITATNINRDSASSIRCDLPLTGVVAGTWSLVVTNPDGQAASASFLVKSQADALTLSSITPSSAEVNTTVSITSLAGTNFFTSPLPTIKLVNPYYNDIIGTTSTVNAAGTVITGTFNLNQKVPGTYQVCVFNDANTYTCGLSFRILSPGESTTTNSSIYFQTNPSGATVWLNKTKVGTSTFTYYNATPGTHPVLIQKAGYKDYTGTVTVLEGKRVTFYAPLTLIGQDTTAVTTTYAPPTKTVTTVKKSTLKLPTTYPSPAPTESPVDPASAIVAAAAGAIMLVMRRQ